MSEWRKDDAAARTRAEPEAHTPQYVSTIFQYESLRMTLS
jgi:hypothetical protein